MDPLLPRNSVRYSPNIVSKMNDVLVSQESFSNQKTEHAEISAGGLNESVETTINILGWVARRWVKFNPGLTLLVSVVLLNPPILSSYFSLYKFERNLFLIFSSMLCLISSHILITKGLILYMLCKENLGVDKWLGLKG